MGISFPNGSVAADGWSVGATLGAGYPAGGRLSVCRFYDRGGALRFRPGDGDGRDFASEAERESYNRTRGYVVPYLNAARGTFKAIHRGDIRRWTRGAVLPAIRRAASHADIVAIADAHKRRAVFLGLGILDAITFANGVYCAARRLRPDLYQLGPATPMDDAEREIVAELFDETDSDRIPVT